MANGAKSGPSTKSGSRDGSHNELLANPMSYEADRPSVRDALHASVNVN